MDDNSKYFGYVLDVLNTLHVVLACLTIFGAISLKVLFRDTWWYSAPRILPNVWIAIGCFLIIVSVFGLFATIKNRKMMINLYAVSIILQITAAITGFTLLPKTGTILRDSLNFMMGGNEYERRPTIYWIQETYECCGNNGPSDWNLLLSTRPDSCCSSKKEYYYCARYHERGCHSLLYDIVLRCILTIASSALVVGLLQIWGIMCLLGLLESDKRKLNLMLRNRRLAQ